MQIIFKLERHVVNLHMIFSTRGIFKRVEKRGFRTCGFICGTQLTKVDDENSDGGG